MGGHHNRSNKNRIRRKKQKNKKSAVNRKRNSFSTKLKRTWTGAKEKIK
jgi:hypothetical protein